jgi:MFS transporter, DHA1 family, multidrug resistance protein
MIIKKGTYQSMEPWRKNLYSLWAAQFLAMMGMNLVVPFLPFFIRELGITDPDAVATWSGWVYSGPFFLSFFLTPIWGILGDKYGRKAMTVRAIFGLAISQAFIGFSNSVEMLFFFRLVQGAISGFIASSLALVSSSTPKEKSGYAIGVLQSASSFGAVIGPFIGGALADLFGYRPIFFIVASICAIAGLVVVRFVHETTTAKTTRLSFGTIIENYRFSFNSPSIRIALIIIFLSQVAMVMIQPVFALFVDSLETNKEYLATIAGAIFSTAGLFMVISSPWWGHRNDAKSFRKNLSVAIVGAAIAYAAQGFVVKAYQLILFRALQGFCMGGILPTLYTYISKISPQERRGGTIGIATSSNIFASMIGPTFGGYIAASFGLRGNFFITGGLLLVALSIVQSLFVDVPSTLVHSPVSSDTLTDGNILEEVN